MPRYLIIRFSSIGDIVLTTPVIRCLKQQVPGCEVHYLTKNSFASLLQHNPYIDKIYSIKDHVNEVMEDLKKENYDAVIDLHHNIRSLQVKTALKKKSFSFDKLNIKKWLTVNFKLDILPKKHIVDRYLETVKSLNVVNDGNGLDYFMARGSDVDIRLLPAQLQDGYIAFVIGAKHATKMFPVERIAQVILKARKPFILIGGKDDTARGAEIEKMVNERFPEAYIYNACGSYSLDQSASLIKQSSMVLTNDTGFMHIAAAFNKKIISIWGNTIPEFGMTPYYPSANASQSRIFEIKNLYCRPCSKIGYDKCPKGHFRCMLEIDTTSIAETAVELTKS